jgi:hypothetical protein
MLTWPDADNSPMAAAIASSVVLALLFMPQKYHKTPK